MLMLMLFVAAAAAVAFTNVVVADLLMQEFVNFEGGTGGLVI